MLNEVQKGCRDALNVPDKGCRSHEPRNHSARCFSGIFCYECGGAIIGLDRRGHSKENLVKTKTIRQSVAFKASAHAVYEALMDSKKHSQFTGSKSSVSRKVGGKINAWDGYIEGTNLELVQDKKIVQSWRASDWAPGHYSKATFSLEETENGIRLAFTQTGVPEEFYEYISQGWQDFYWKPMKEMLEKE